MTVDSKMPVLILESADPMPGSNPSTPGSKGEVPVKNVEELLKGKVPGLNLGVKPGKTK